MCLHSAISSHPFVEYQSNLSTWNWKRRLDPWLSLIIIGEVNDIILVFFPDIYLPQGKVMFFCMWWVPHLHIELRSTHEWAVHVLDISVCEVTDRPHFPKKWAKTVGNPLKRQQLLSWSRASRLTCRVPTLKVSQSITFINLACGPCFKSHLTEFYGVPYRLFYNK